MPRGASTFRERDLRVMVKALRDAGVTVISARLTPAGEIIIDTIDKPLPLAHKGGAGSEPAEPSGEEQWASRLKELGY